MPLRRKNRVRARKVLHGIVVLAVLFYVLLPKTGFCGCPDCDCRNNLLSLNDSKVEKPVRSCCRKQADPASEVPVSETPKSCCSRSCSDKTTKKASSCCSKTCDSNQDETSTNCDCSCSETKAPVPPPADTASQVLQELKISSDLKVVPLSVSWNNLVPETLERNVFYEKTQDSVTSRFPVRLHLMYQILQN